MVRIFLLSRRNPKGEWMIRNRHGVYLASDRKGIAAAKHAAALRIPGWQRAEPFTEFMVSEERVEQ